MHQRIKKVEEPLGLKGLHLHSFVVSPSTFAKASITEWTVPDGVDFDEYAATQYVYVLPIGGATAITPYVGKIVAQMVV